MVGDLIAGVGALKTAYDIAKGLKDIDDKVTLNAAVIDLQERILSAQQATFEAAEEMRTLRSKLDHYENWDAVSARYVLKDFGGDTFAYELREDAGTGEPKHLACPNCFEQRRRSILQYDDRYIGRRRFNCMGCGKHVELGEYRQRNSSTVADDYSPF